jgi:hypothetical protein
MKSRISQDEPWMECEITAEAVSPANSSGKTGDARMTTNKDESRPTTGRVLPLQKKIGDPGFWGFFLTYLLLGASAAIILLEIVESGVFGKLVAPLVLLVIAILNLARLQAAERKPAEPPAPGDADKPRP